MRGWQRWLQTLGAALQGDKTPPAGAGGAGPAWQSLIDQLEKQYLANAWDEAMETGKEALALAKRTVGSDHPDVAATLNNLALICRAQNQHAQAELYLNRALAIWESACGGDHPDVAIALNNLALLCIARGQYAQAEPIYLRSLAIREQAFGPDHPEVATSLENLASLYRASNRLSNASKLEERARRIRLEHPS
jgi:tetratricopeptide (TPR) repeat protein